MPWPKVARAVFLSRPVAGAVSQSDPSRGASNLTGRRNCEPVKPRNSPPRESDCGMIGSVEPVSSRRRPRRHRDTGQVAMFEVPGVGEDGMSGRNVQRKLGTTRGSPRRSRTAKASRISRRAVKSRCACEWGGWGRLSDDGPGQNNPSAKRYWRACATRQMRQLFDPAGMCVNEINSNEAPPQTDEVYQLARVV